MRLSKLVYQPSVFVEVTKTDYEKLAKAASMHYDPTVKNLMFTTLRRFADAVQAQAAKVTNYLDPSYDWRALEKDEFTVELKMDEIDLLIKALEPFDERVLASELKSIAKHTHNHVFYQPA